MSRFNVRFFFLILILNSPCLFAQAMDADSLKSIEKQVLSLDDTDLEILAKSRKLILQKIKDNKIAEVQDVIIYLNNKFDGRYVIKFWDVEKYLLGYIIGDLDLVLEARTDINRSNEDINQMIQPPRDLMVNKLENYCRQNIARIQDSIEGSNKEEYEKEFLRLFIKYILGPADRSTQDDMEFQKELNQLADEYLTRNAYSPYNPIVREYIRVVYKSSDWGYGFDFHTGYLQLKDNIQSYFKDMLPLGVAFEGSYKDLSAYLRLTFAVAGKVKKSFEHHGIWREGLKMGLGIPELSCGYNLLGNSSGKLVPFAGISYVEFSPPEIERKKAGNDVKLGYFSYVYGVNLDWKIGSMPQRLSSPNELFYFIVKFRISCNRCFDPSKITSGTIINFNIGIGGYGRKYHRDL
jgi:hypothetical protein